MPRYFKTLGPKTIAIDGKETYDWKFDLTGRLRHIHLVETGGRILYKSLITALIQKEAITRPECSCQNFTPDDVGAPDVDWPISEGQEFKATVENKEGADIEVLITLEIEA